MFPVHLYLLILVFSASLIVGSRYPGIFPCYYAIFPGKSRNIMQFSVVRSKNIELLVDRTRNMVFLDTRSRNMEFIVHTLARA